MFKKIFSISLILFLFLALVACKKVVVNNNIDNSNESVPETGKIIDISGKNGQVIFAVPGDAILIELAIEQNSGFQWSFREPVAGGLLSLKEHDTAEKSRWIFKIEKPAQFNIRLDYEDAMAEKVKDAFLVKIVTDKNSNEIQNILLDSPASGSKLKSPAKLSGFARVFEGTVNYRLKSGDKILAEGFVTASAGGPEFGYFEKEIKFNDKVESAILEVYQINAENGEEIDKVIIELKK